MTDQLNFVKMMEEDAIEEKRKAIFREHYQLWLKAPDLYIVPDDMREEMKGYPHATHCDIYGSTLHVCDENDRTHYFWLNPGATPKGGGEYWVMNENGNPAGELVEICPYCGANLRKGEGRIALKKNHSREKYYNEESVRKYYALDRC